MECPYKLPVYKPQHADYLGNYLVLDACKGIVMRDLTSEQADFIVLAINCHKKFKVASAKAYEGLCTNDLDACDEAIKLLDEVMKEAEKP